MCFFSLQAESQLSLDLRMMQTLFRGSDDQIYSLGSGTAGLSFRSTGNRDVRGDLQMDFVPTDISLAGMNYSEFNLKKASVKVRFPGLRITMGKTRVGWGDGFVFNSGDVLFGSLSPLVDLTQDEARSETAWLTLLRWSPAGRTYVEGIYMPPTPSVDLETQSHSLKDISYSSGGGRLVTEIADLIVETGYFYKGESKVIGDVTGHRPYLTLHGELFFDLYASASLAIPAENAEWDKYRGSMNFSAGMFRQFQLWYNGTLSARLEALCFPYQKWEELDYRLDPTGSEIYGLFLYPELNLAIGQNLNLPLMAVVSPVDQSAQITTGFSWKVYQGFSFLGYGIIGLGDETDVFSWDRRDSATPLDQVNGWSAMAGMRYQF